MSKETCTLSGGVIRINIMAPQEMKKSSSGYSKMKIKTGHSAMEVKGKYNLREREVSSVEPCLGVRGALANGVVREPR